MIKATLAFLALLSAAACVYAADGQVLINQATVNAAGGFPYVITQPGSYKLSGNLIVTDKNKTAIRIAADFVTIDLNGFTILGPNDCSSGVCSASGLGNGIETAVGHVHFNITIRNGTVQGMGLNGIHLSGDSFLVEYMHIRSNYADGIYLDRRFASGTPSQLVTVEHCNAELNGAGIVIEGGQVNYNNSSRNRSLGIELLEGGVASVTHNVVVANLAYGIYGPSSTFTYNNNVLRFNGANVFFSSGLNTGGNLCDGVLCP